MDFKEFIDWCLDLMTAIVLDIGDILIESIDPYCRFSPAWWVASYIGEWEIATCEFFRFKAAAWYQSMRKFKGKRYYRRRKIAWMTYCFFFDKEQEFAESLAELGWVRQDLE